MIVTDICKDIIDDLCLPPNERKFKAIDIGMGEEEDTSFERAQQTKPDPQKLYFVNNFMIQLTYYPSGDNTSAIVPEHKLYKTLGHGIADPYDHL